MKKWIFGFLIIFLALSLIYIFVVKPEKTNVLPANTSIILSKPPPAEIKQSIAIDYNNSLLRISWAIVEPEKINLYSNLIEKKLSEEIKVNNSCMVLVNGGFYSKESTHLGLFTTNYNTISETINSDLLNGFLSVTSNGIAIESNVPVNNPRIAMQSGPLLKINGNLLPLSIKNDKPDRRIAVGITNNKLIFLAFYLNGSINQGPLLGDLPEIFEIFEEKTNIQISDAINMDGGIHSVFITPYERLNELAHIGSYFCVEK